jgi:hypothetical protein
MSDNSEILIIQHLRRAVPRAEVLLFTRRKASAMKQVDLRDFFFTLQIFCAGSWK